MALKLRIEEFGRDFAWEGPAMGMRYFNKTSRPIEVGIITTMNDGIYADGWFPVQPENNVAIGNPHNNFDTHTYWIIACIQGQYLLGGGPRFEPGDVYSDIEWGMANVWFNNNGYHPGGGLEQNDTMAKSMRAGDFGSFRDKYAQPASGGVELTALKIHNLRTYTGGETCIWIHEDNTWERYVTVDG